MAAHDAGYKLLFSHAEMVADLLRGFVAEEWVAELHFATLERVNASFVRDDLRGREDDIISRVQWGPRWLYVYLLLEFQSRVDRFMALRILAYVALLYQQLVRDGELSPEGLLPPVLPVVLYNGERRWRAPQDVSELVETVPGALSRYAPRLRHLLLDEGAYDEKALAEQRNLVAALFRLERACDPDAVAEVLGGLAEWLGAPQQSSLRRAFTVWLGRVLLPARVPGVEIPELRELAEVRSMLAERVKEWTRQWKAEGLAEGREEGRRLGLEEGRQEGREEGRQEGREEGRQEGRQEGREEGERRLLRRQLERRFGRLPAWAERRVTEARTADLERWAELVLDAGRLNDVFGETAGEDDR